MCLQIAVLINNLTNEVSQAGETICSTISWSFSREILFFRYNEYCQKNL